VFQSCILSLETRTPLLRLAQLLLHVFRIPLHRFPLLFQRFFLLNHDVHLPGGATVSFPILRHLVTVGLQLGLGFVAAFLRLAKDFLRKTVRNFEDARQRQKGTRNSGALP
jgi:hypothetical protein